MRREAVLVADGLVAADFAPLERLFEGIHTEPPALLWSPSEEQLADEVLIFLRRYWLDRKRGDDLPRSREIDAWI